jgi:hypothetical protein
LRGLRRGHAAVLRQHDHGRNRDLLPWKRLPDDRRIHDRHLRGLRRLGAAVLHEQHLRHGLCLPDQFSRRDG